jgi:VanZ family protein
MLKKEQLWAWSPVVLYAFFIFVLSAQPDKYMPELFFGSDKLAHLLEYFPFGYLVLRAFVKGSNMAFGREALLMSIFVIMLYSLSDETHQLFVPGRQFDLMDMFFDTVGGLMGSFFSAYAENRTRRK